MMIITIPNHMLQPDPVIDLANQSMTFFCPPAVLIPDRISHSLGILRSDGNQLGTTYPDVSVFLCVCARAMYPSECIGIGRCTT